MESAVALALFILAEGSVEESFLEMKRRVEFFKKQMRVECERPIVLRTRVRLYEKPDRNSLILETLGKGEKLCMVKREDGWYAVRTERGLPGYVEAGALGLPDGAESEEIDFREFLK